MATNKNKIKPIKKDDGKIVVKDGKAVYIPREVKPPQYRPYWLAY